jgi:DNA-binding CsgD family transcriptional regulator
MAKCSMLDEAEFAGTLGLIYEVAVAPERRVDLLDQLGRDFRCHGVGLIATSQDRSRYDGVLTGVDREEHQRFLRRFHRANPVRVAAPHRFAGHILDLREALPRAALERSEMYQTFFRPNRLDEGVGLTTWKGSDGVEAFSLMRSAKLGPFAAHEMARLRMLAPHLQRMSMVTRHLQHADLMAHAACQALDAVPQATVLLDRSGRLVHANAAAEALLRAGDGIAARRGGLVGATAAATAQLAALIAAASSAPRSAGAMRLPRPSGKPALAVVAMPTRGLSQVALAEPPTVLLCIADPAARGMVTPRLLMTVLRLTRAEAALAIQLLAGQDLRSIAQQSARSVNTVRNLLARLMAKTDTSRQSELMRLLGELSRLPHGE